MRILYVSQYFPPEMGAPSARVHEMSRAWTWLGHPVTVLTAFAHHPTGIKARRDRWVLTRRERTDGIDLLRAYVWAAANRGVARRALSYASWALSAAAVGALRAPRPAVVIATSPQLLCGLAGWALARRFRVPFVFEVRDLWPESVLAVEALRPGRRVASLQRLAGWLYRECDRIVTVGDGYKRGIQRLYGIPAEKIAVVPNGVDLELFRPRPRDNEVRRQHGWGDRFVVLYLGTLGMAHALDHVLKAARELRHHPQVLFALVGEGAEKERLLAACRELGLGNVQFIGQQPKARVPLYYAACDLGLVTLRDTQLFREVLPSKIFEYLAMERPLLVAAEGEARRVVEEAGAGIAVPPEDGAAIAKAVLGLLGEPARLTAMGLAGRPYVVAHHDREKLALAYLDVLEEVTRRHGGHPGAHST